MVTLILNSMVHTSALHWKSVNFLSKLALSIYLLSYALHLSANMGKIYSLPVAAEQKYNRWGAG